MNEAYWMFDGHPRKFREIISRRKKKKGERQHCWHDMTPLTTSAQQCVRTQLVEQVSTCPQHMPVGDRGSLAFAGGRRGLQPACLGHVSIVA
jgi:hypothetical protein